MTQSGTTDRAQTSPRTCRISLDDVFESAKEVTDRPDPTGERLVCVVFAPRGARLWRELKYSVAYLDAQTGDDWDRGGLDAIEPAGGPIEYESDIMSLIGQILDRPGGEGTDRRPRGRLTRTGCTPVAA